MAYAALAGGNWKHAWRWGVDLFSRWKYQNDERSGWKPVRFPLCGSRAERHGLFRGQPAGCEILPVASQSACSSPAGLVASPPRENFFSVRFHAGRPRANQEWASLGLSMKLRVGFDIEPAELLSYGYGYERENPD